MHTVLIAEDDASIRQLLTMVVRKAGYDAQAVPDGSSALAQLRAGDYDVLLLDLMMPGMDGFMVIDSLRAKAPDLLRRCVVVTATGAREHEAIRHEVFRVVQKPFDVDELKRAIDDCIAARGPSLSG